MTKSTHPTWDKMRKEDIEMQRRANSDYINEDGTMTKRCFDGTLEFHQKNLEAFKKYRPTEVKDVEKAIEDLKNRYPQYVESK